MKKLYCNGKKDFCPYFDGTKLPTCHILNCAFIDNSGTEVVEIPNTNYDRIRNMSIDEMAALFYGIIHERDLHIMKALGEKGIDASLIEFSPEIHISYHKHWLESEAE